MCPPAVCCLGAAASPVLALASHRPAHQEACLRRAQGSRKRAEVCTFTGKRAASECRTLCSTWCPSLLSAGSHGIACCCQQSQPEVDPLHPCSAADCLLLRRHSQSTCFLQVVIQTIENNALVWLGSMFAPLLPALGLMANCVTFYTMWSLAVWLYDPPTTRYSASRTSNMAYGLMLREWGVVHSAGKPPRCQSRAARCHAA